MKVKKDGQVIDINESDIKKMIKLMSESNSEFIGGISASERGLLIQDVINRIDEFGYEYELRLRQLNADFTPKRVRTLTGDDFQKPNPELKIGKTTYYKD
jgi:hypothetical protein